MNKKVLVIYYSQSGQLGDIINSFCSPLMAAGNTVEMIRVLPLKAYPFPWTGKSFFAVMPDCVLGVPTELQPIQLMETEYDLIVLGYQAWYSLHLNLESPICIDSFKKYPGSNDHGCPQYVDQCHGTYQKNVESNGSQACGKYCIGGQTSKLCEFCHHPLLDVHWKKRPLLKYLSQAWCFRC
jgi:hypothetical protein